MAGLQIKKLQTVKKYFDEHIAQKMILLSVVLNLVLESLCRQSLLRGFAFLFKSPVQFLYGALIILFTVTLSGLVKRRYFAELFISIVWLGLGVTDFIIGFFRITPLTAGDFQILFSVFSIVNIYLNPLQIVLIAILIIAVVAGLFIAFVKLPKVQSVDYLRAGFGCFIASWILWSCTWLFLNKGYLADQFENLGTAYNEYGFAYCFTSGIFDRGIDEPEVYSLEEVDTVVDQLEEMAAESDPALAAVKPNIIVVQLESFIDPSHLSKLSYSENPTPVFSGLKKKYSTGFLTVPSIGAGTANSEFEVLSGMSLDYFGTGEYPYKTVLQSNVCESYNYVLKQMGYKCHAVHNHTATFYGRDQVYRNLGFDTFTSLEYMENAVENPIGWAEDAVLTEEVLKAMDSTEGRDFVYTISVQPHGRYPTEVIDPTQTILVDGLETEEETNAFTYFINQLSKSDAFIGDLIKELKRRTEPTVLVLFGDHYPNLEIGEDDISGGTLLQTEYVIWSNCGLEKHDEDLYAYQLMSEVLKRLGYTDGVLNKLHQERENNSSYEQDLEILEYDILYGDHYVYDGTLPYEPTELQFGITPICVTKAENLNGQVYVTGRHFTAASKIVINEKVMYDTLFINSNTLLLPDTVLEESDSVAAAQVTGKGEVLSATDRLIYK